MPVPPSVKKSNRSADRARMDLACRPDFADTLLHAGFHRKFQSFLVDTGNDTALESTDAASLA